jgi:hypothetical protein
MEDLFKNLYEIWITAAKDDKSGRVRLVRRYIALWRQESKWSQARRQKIGGIAVFEVVRGEKEF